MRTSEKAQELIQPYPSEDHSSRSCCVTILDPGIPPRTTGDGLRRRSERPRTVAIESSSASVTGGTRVATSPHPGRYADSGSPVSSPVEWLQASSTGVGSQGTYELMELANPDPTEQTRTRTRPVRSDGIRAS